MFIHPLSHQTSTKHLECAKIYTNAWWWWWWGGGVMESSNPITVFKGLEKYLNMIKQRCYWKHRTQMNIKLGLTKINFWQRITCCMFPFLWNSTTDELTCARRHQSSGCFATGEDDKGTFFHAVGAVHLGFVFVKMEQPTRSHVFNSICLCWKK